MLLVHFDYSLHAGYKIVVQKNSLDGTVPAMRDQYQVCLMMPKGYEGSLVFREIIFLLRNSIRSNGLTCEIKLNELSEDKINIIVGYQTIKFGEYLSKYRYIPYQLEQLDVEGGWYTDNARLILENADEIWDYSEHNIRFLAERNIEAMHLPIGYHEDLEQIEHASGKDIDVLFYGTFNDRRTKILDELNGKPDISVKAIAGVFGKERDEFISRSKTILNLHYYPSNLLEEVRISYLLNNKCFVVSETSESSPYDNLGIVTADYEDLVETCLYYLNSNDEIERIRYETYEKFKTLYPMTELINKVL